VKGSCAAEHARRRARSRGKGRTGYPRIIEAQRDTAMDLSAAIAQLGPFELASDGSNLPVFALKLKDEVTGYSVFDVSEKLREFGWQVPAYTMPEHAEDIAVLRILVREGFSGDMADRLLEHLQRRLGL
jgi:glutamate decarboxylase